MASGPGYPRRGQTLGCPNPHRRNDRLKNGNQGANPEDGPDRAVVPVLVTLAGGPSFLIEHPENAACDQKGRELVLFRMSQLLSYPHRQTCIPHRPDSFSDPYPYLFQLLKQRRTPSQRFWFTVYEWIGDKVVDFVFFYLPKDLDIKSRIAFHQVLVTAASHKTLCQLLSIEGDSQTFANRINADIKDLGKKKGCSDWIELYIGILFLEYHDEFWEAIQRIVSFTVDHWKLDPHAFSLRSNDIKSISSNSPRATAKSFEQQTIIQSSESNKSNVNHSNNRSKTSSLSIEEKTRNKSSHPSSSKTATRLYSILMLAWIGIDVLRDSIKSSPQIVQNCSNILMTLLNELVLRMWKTCDNLQLPSFTSKNTRTIEQSSNSSSDVTIIDTFKDKVSQYLIDNRFQTKALYNAFLDLASIKTQLDDFRREIISILNLTKIYNFIFASE